MPEKQAEYNITAGPRVKPLDDYDFFNLPADLVDDWRWDRVRHLGILWLDAQLVEKQAALVLAQRELDDAVAHARDCKRRLESREGRVRKGIDEKEIFGTARTNKDERETKRVNIVRADQDYQTRLDAYNQAVAIKDRAEADRDFAEQAVKNVRMRLNARMWLIQFITSIKPIPLASVPDEEGKIPALQAKPKPKEEPVPMNEQTRDWLAAMQNKDARHGMVGKLALQVLPEGVDPDHPRVQEVRADIRKHFGEGPKL